MRNLCLDEGILQSYYDGQLAPEVLKDVVSHLATCSVCADTARLVEREMDLATAAFASEFALSVPTERLRARLDDAILDLNTHTLPQGEATSGVRGWLTSVATAFNLTPHRAIGFASLLIFFFLAAVVGGIVLRQRAVHSGLEIIAGNQNEPGDLSFRGVEETGTPRSNFNNARSRTSMRRSVRRRASGTTSNNEMQLAHRPLQGERNYLKAISLLTEAIEANGETSLKPTLLADYKRNLAVVDQAISATQRTARTNPKSEDAAEMLYAVYQSKLDLLSVVAEQSRPMIAQR